MNIFVISKPFLSFRYCDEILHYKSVGKAFGYISKNGVVSEGT